MAALGCLWAEASALAGKSNVWEQAQERAILPLATAFQKLSHTPVAAGPELTLPSPPTTVLSAHGGLGAAFHLYHCPTGIFGTPGWVCPAVAGD